jgi:TolB-like protein
MTVKITKSQRAILCLIILAFLGPFLNDVVALQKEIPSAASTIADDIAISGKRSVAVVDFTNLQGNVTELGRYLAEEIALGLVTTKKNLSLVDRTHLRTLMQEHKLATTGVIDPATARQLGKIVGVEVLVTGTITPFADSVRVVIKALDTDTARIVAASSIDIGKTRTIEELLARDVVVGSNAAILPSVKADASDTAAGSRGSVFQNEVLRATANQVSVTADNFHATLDMTIENISRQPLRIALDNFYGGEGFDNGSPVPKIELSDDRATTWENRTSGGLQIVKGYKTLSEIDKESFTVLAPGERITVINRFLKTNSVNTPGTTFSFAAMAIYEAPSGLRRISIGFTGVKPTVQKR